MKMQRRHFELIAGIIRELPDGLTQREIAERFAKALDRTNPQFKTATFIEAATRD